VAISFVTQRLLGTVTGASVVNATPGVASTIAQRNTLLLYVVADNSNTGGIAPVVTVADPRGNQWKLVSSRLRDPGIANEGIWVSVWQCYVGYTYVDLDAVVITFNATMARVAVCIQEWSGVSPLTYPDGGPATDANNGTAATAGAVTTPLGSLIVALTGVETNVALTGDADVTGGAWSALVTAVSDSGVAATSIRMGIQTKVPNVAGAQTNTMTWAGAADWASVAFSLLAAPTPITFPAVVGNPNYPCIIGPEILPIRDLTVPVDTGTMHIIGHFLTPNTAVGTSEYTVAASYENPNIRQQHTLIYELWTPLQLAAAEDDQITTVRLPLRTVTLDVNASVVGGGSAVDALRSVGGSYVTIDGSVTNGLQVLRFDTTKLADYAGTTRVVRVGIQYLGWKDDSSPPIPGEGINVRWNDTLAPEVQSSNPGFWLVPDYQRNARIITKWLGEINALARGSLTPASTPLSVTTHRAPFTLLDLEHMDSGDESTSVVIRGLQGYDLLQTAINLDFIELVVELVPERRTAAVARRIQNLDPDSAGYGAEITSHMLDVINTANSKALADPAYFLTVREALPASSSDQLRADPTSGTLTRYSTFEAIGPSIEMKAVGQPRATLFSIQTLEKALVANGVFRGGAVNVNDYVLSMVGFDQFTVGADGAMMVGYEGVSTPSYVRVHTTLSRASYVATGGGTYDHIKLLVKPDPGTTLPLTISVEQPLATPLATATVTVADATAAPDRGFGWKEVSVPLSVPVNPVSGAVVLVFSSTTPATVPWHVGSARPTGNNYIYGYLPNILPTADPLGASRPNDVAAVLACPLPEPVLTLGDGTIPFENPELFCFEADSITIPELTITDVADYDHLLIERDTNATGEWSIVALLHEEDGSLISPFYDVSAPWDVELRYRVTGFRDSDRSQITSSEESWASGPITAPGAAFGLASTEDAQMYLYVPVSSGDLETVWRSLDPVDNLQQHGADYSVALRAVENRGLQVTIEVQVANFEACFAGDPPANYPEVLPTPGAYSFTPYPFLRLTQLQKVTRLGLILPGGHTRFVSLSLGPMTVHTTHGVYKAELTLTDVRPPESNPWPQG
jgi:hypothetical protein